MPIEKDEEYKAELMRIASVMYPPDGSGNLAAFMHGARVATDMIMHLHSEYGVELEHIVETTYRRHQHNTGGWSVSSFINVEDKIDILFWTTKFRCSEETLLAAIEKVGNEIVNVEKWFAENSKR